MQIIAEHLSLCNGLHRVQQMIEARPGNHRGDTVKCADRVVETRRNNLQKHLEEEDKQEQIEAWLPVLRENIEDNFRNNAKCAMF